MLALQEIDAKGIEVSRKESRANKYHIKWVEQYTSVIPISRGWGRRIRNSRPAWTTKNFEASLGYRYMGLCLKQQQKKCHIDLKDRVRKGKIHSNYLRVTRLSNWKGSPSNTCISPSTRKQCIPSAITSYDSSIKFFYHRKLRRIHLWILVLLLSAPKIK